MKKIKAFGYVFVKSVSSLKYYADVVKTNFSFSLKYYLVLAAILAVVSTGAIAAPKVPEIKNTLKTFISKGVESFPEDLVVTIKNSELSINQPEPYYIPIPENTDFENRKLLENMVVFDSMGTIGDLEEYKTLVLVNKTNILVQGGNKIEVYPLKDVPDTEISKDNVVELANKMEPLVKSIAYIIVVFVLLGTVIYYGGIRFMYTAAIATPIIFVANIFAKTNLTYTKAVQIGLHSITAPLVVEFFLGVFQVQLPVRMWFLLLHTLIGVITLFTIRDELRLPVVEENQENTPQN